MGFWFVVDTNQGAGIMFCLAIGTELPKIKPLLKHFVLSQRGFPETSNNSEEVQKKPRCVEDLANGLNECKNHLDHCNEPGRSNSFKLLPTISFLKKCRKLQRLRRAVNARGMAHFVTADFSQ